LNYREEVIMQVPVDRILTTNLVLSTVIFYVIARIYLLPKLSELKPQTVLVPILLLHSTRHLGLMFLAPGAVYPGMPAQFAYPAAIGDFIAAVLALVALAAVIKNLQSARFLVWLFNIEGSVDLVIAIILATISGAPAYMGAAYWIPALWVPALLVSHYITFVILLTSWKSVDSYKRWQ
jgi:hypothetical protein